MESREQERDQMVQNQIEARGVHSVPVLRAMRTVPRESFVPEPLREFAYEDTPLPIEEAQTISQPFIVALMVEAAEVRPGAKVLEVGAGSGYAAAVLSRIAERVYAIERHGVLATMARRRMHDLGYENVEVRHADGTLGWAEHAPFDAILVAAGGPDVPETLLAQLAVGGCLVIPVGADLRTQELIRVRRVSETETTRESLGRVQFVPLVGTEGWAVDGTSVGVHRAPGPLRVLGSEQREVSGLIRSTCEPFDDLDTADLGPLLSRIGTARIVLIGEASHGTHEFYRMRARITKALIEEQGFELVAIEGDWPDVHALDLHVRGEPGAPLPQPAFSRFPTWMWRNREMRAFVDWLTEHNAAATDRVPVGLVGLDLYSLFGSIGAVLDYLDSVDPAAAAAARARYGCLSPYETDPAAYGRAAVGGRIQPCEHDVVAALSALLARRMDYLGSDGERFFDAEQNAKVVRDAERYYRVMYYGARESWNLRDRHMFETLEAVLAHRGADARAVVWAHNSHVGNATATEMGARGELNIGQLVRERYGSDAYAIGFGTDHGTVAATSSWDEPVQIKTVRPSHPDSYERLCHESRVPAFLLPLRQAASETLRNALFAPHLERAIGVIYRPETELLSHYFQAVLPAQFDEYIWFDESRAVTPLEAHELAGVPDTYPFGL